MSESGERHPVRRRRLWDVVVSIVLAVLLVPSALGAAAAGALLAFAGDSCGTVIGRSCHTGQLSAGILLAVVGPGVIALIAIVVTIVRLVRSRLAVWVPIVGFVLMVVVWIVGYVVVKAAVPSAG